MFTLNDMPPPLPAAQLEKLRQVYTANVCHIRHWGFLDHALRAVLPDVRVAGTAVTLRIPGPDSTLLHHLMGLVRPGDFLVIDRAGDARHACWGGVITHVAAKRGIAGAAVDGMATDIAEFRKHGLPMWCRGPSPITTKLLALGGELNVPVSCGGVTVAPGDAVLADECGVLVLKPGEIDAVADRALAMQAREVTLLERIDAGESLPEITGATAKIKAAMESA
jgi:regulator of RNase E activity RraA